MLFGTFIVLTSSLLHSVSSFYLPGLLPTSYCKEGSPDVTCRTAIELYVNRLTSTDSVIPYDYSAFDFCAPINSVGKDVVPKNLGQVLFGERIHYSPYEFSFGKNVTCSSVCSRSYEPNDKKLEFLKYGMLFSYEHHWIVDNLPVAWCYRTTDGSQYCSPGFPMGCYVDKKRRPKDACQMDPKFNAADTFYLFNHVDIFIRYHTGDGRDWKGARIVEVTVTPRSFDSDKCSGEPLAIPKETKAQVDINYTYGVYFIPDNAIEWASRWDYVLEDSLNTNIHWFSIMNSLIVVLFLSVMDIVIMFRAVPKAIARYENMENEDDGLAKFGWKRIHGDVFRPPNKPMLLAAVNGVGTQIFAMTIVTLLFACLGFLSPANRGALETIGITLFVCFSVVSGYTSARLYKTFGGERRKANVMVTAFLLSGIAFTIFIAMNLILWGAESSAAVPFNTLVEVLAIWFGISVPLTFVGAFFGYRKRPIEHPVQINETPREIPPKRVHIRIMGSILSGGILPFGCIFIKLFFVFNSIWSHQLYYMFGFTFIVVVILIITCSEVAVLLCYFNLTKEDYHWWWRSFLMSGSTAVYFFAYAIHFYVTKLAIEGVTSAILYVGYNLIMTLAVFLFCGTCGFMASFWFVTKIYGMKGRKTTTMMEDKNPRLKSGITIPACDFSCPSRKIITSAE